MGLRSAQKPHREAATARGGKGQLGSNICRMSEIYWRIPMKLQIADVQCALVRLLNHYPESGHNSQTLANLAVDWVDLLDEEGVTQKQFAFGVRHAVKTCSFFPKVADVLKGVREYRERPPATIEPTSTMLTDETSRHNLTPEEVERNRSRVQLIVKALSGQMSFDEAERDVAAMSHIGEFSAVDELSGKRGLV